MNANLKKRGTALVEMLVAMSILILVMIPISFSFLGEKQEFGIYYHRGVAMELVDGEMEILRAGQWRAFKEGAQPYNVQSPAATNLPPGRFVLSRRGQHLRLQWVPAAKNEGGLVSREADVQ